MKNDFSFYYNPAFFKVYFLLVTSKDSVMRQSCKCEEKQSISNLGVSYHRNLGFISRSLFDYVYLNLFRTTNHFLLSAFESLVLKTNTQLP